MVVPLDKRPRSGPYSGINARSAKRFLSEQFRHAGLDMADEDARDLVLAVTGFSFTDFALRGTEFLTPEQFDLIKDYADQRLGGAPVDAILGWREFYGRRFTVTKDVLSPRGDTENLVDCALHALKTVNAPRLLDLGTGSGAVLLTLLAERQEAKGIAADISDDALAVAKANARDLDLISRVEFIKSDWFSEIEGRFDLIVSNPPYITDAAMETLARDVLDYDPDLALRGGPDGLKPYHIILQEAELYLKEGGACWVEIGFDQGKAVKKLFEQNGFKKVEVVKDLAGHDRCVGGNI